MALSESSLLHMFDSLLAKLASPSIQQASLDIGVFTNLQKFKETLLSLKHMLLEVDYKPKHDPEMQRWLRKHKQVFNDAENMLDDIHWESLFGGGKQQWLKALITKVGRSISASNPLLFRPTMATQINDITKRLQHCADEKIYVDAPLLYKRGGEVTFPYINQYDVIGRNIDKEIVIEKLLMHHHHNDDDDDGQSSLSVLPIVGMRGLGKTTLAQLVYNDPRIDMSFPLKVWVSVSHDHNTEQMVSNIVISAPPHIHSHNDVELLKYKLAGQKFLLVLDNVWKEDPLKWDELRNLIPKGVDGSKILLTTPSHSIASMAGTIPSHNLEPLTLNDSLSLFDKCATKLEAKKYSHLIKVGREIVNKCGGIPLAIKTIYDMVEWESTRDSEFNDLAKEDGISPALRLNYHYLSLHLKQCFELFSLYPSDYVFHSSEVVSIWTALDLLPSPNIDETLEDVAYQCLQELMPSYFLKEFVSFGTSYYFQINDLVHDLARDVAIYECLIVNSNNQDIPENVQHLSFVVNNLSDKSSIPIYANIRTILFPIEGVGATNDDFLNMCVSKYRHLRILDLSDSVYERLPRSIGKLRHLRVLSLERNEKLMSVPDSICKLQNLQVLNLAGCTNLKKLPKGLRNLVSVRRLGITTKESTLPEIEIANMNSLEILNIEFCNNLQSFFVEINLPSLKTLEVSNCGSLKYLPLDIDHFPQLETLLVDNCAYLELTNKQDDQNSSLQLKAIRLQSLPQLLSLPPWLQKSAKKLQSLIIVDCKSLEMLPEWLSTFIVLGSFGVVNCPKLTSLPNDIHHLTALRYLRIEDCPALCRKCQPPIGIYWHKISHVKQIVIGEPEDLKEKEEELKND